VLGPLDHVYYWVTDMDRAVRFYQEVVGLRLLERHDSNWAELDAGSIRLALHGTREGAPVSGGGAAAGFRVDDLDATESALRTRGVRFVHQGEVERLRERDLRGAQHGAHVCSSLSSAPGTVTSEAGSEAVPPV
jgi:catechol 2,3-dioxygenase-like lactoylglutathione lyase family enzyme